MASSKMAPTIGIYLGTEYSCVGVWRDGRVDIIPNDQGNRTTPSYVAFTPDRVLIGEAAENQANRNPTNTIFDINRLIGRRFSDPTVQSNKKLWPFKVIEGAGDKPKIVVQYRGEEKLYYPEEISAMILAKMKEIAENFLERSVQDVVVTVPAFFNDSQIRATWDASAIARLNVKHIMDEPTAAAVAYSYELKYVMRSVLVFDLNISTFDVSVVEQNYGFFKVKTTAGDMHLGGKNFDNLLLNYFLEQIKRKHNKDISDNLRSIRRLRSACEQARKTLSYAASAIVDVYGLYEGNDFSLNITSARFDDINMDLFERCMRLVTKCLEDARMEKNDIHKVVLVGGYTRIPMVQQMLQELFDGTEVCKSMDPNSVVAYGATLQSGIMNYYTPDMKALREIENANQETVALQRELLDATKLSEAVQKQLMSVKDDAKKIREQLKSEIDNAKKDSEAAQKLTVKLMSERDDAKRLTQQLISERDNARKHLEAVQKQLMSVKDDARKLSEMAQRQLMTERDDAIKLSEATQKNTKKLLSERDDAKKDSEAAQKLTEQLMCERDEAKNDSEAAQKLIEQLISERDCAINQAEELRRLTEAAQKQLMSERDDARKLLEMAQEQLMSERDDARKLSEVTQKNTKKLLSERDDAKKHSEAAQILIKQLTSERENAIKQVEELRWLTELQAPCRKCTGCFIGYSYSELQHATDNFHESFKLGEGGFGKVYKGILHDTTVAIKILKEGSSQGAKEFYQEVEVLSKLQHPNLVKLIGACAENHALIYEYLPNGSLEDRLLCENNTTPLSWQARVCIAFEICSALSFLHCTKPHGIVHGDLKPGNVLLDSNNVSKLSDFGLCRQLNLTINASRPFYFTNCAKGTIGYIDPEYLTTAKMVPENDVYSFGIMLLRLVTCKDLWGLRQLVEEAHKKDTLKALIDASAGPWPFKEAKKMISLGLRCSDTLRINRPDLSTVVWKEMKSMADVASPSQWSSWAASLIRQ